MNANGTQGFWIWRQYARKANTTVISTKKIVTILYCCPQIGHGAAANVLGDHFHDLVPLILGFHAVKKDGRKNEGQHGSRWDEPK